LALMVAFRARREEPMVKSNMEGRSESIFRTKPVVTRLELDSCSMVLMLVLLGIRSWAKQRLDAKARP